MDHTRYWIFKIIMSIYIIKKHGTPTENPLMRIQISNIENRIRFKFKAEYYLEILTPGTMKLPGNPKMKKHN